MNANREQEQMLQQAFDAGRRQRLADARHYEMLVAFIKHTPPTRWDMIQAAWLEIESIKNAYNGHPPLSGTL
jgi:hypothetical protein